MAKYKNGNFLQFPRPAFSHLTQCKTSTKWLYLMLNELEHKFTGKNEDFFFRSISDLSKDTGLSRPVVIYGLRELNKIGLIQTWQMHWWKDKESNKKSEKHITGIRILALKAE